MSFVTSERAYTQAQMRLLAVTSGEAQRGSATQSRCTTAPFGRPHTLFQMTGEGPACERDDLLVIDVARHRNHHPLRGVPPYMERVQLRSGHRFDGFDGTDDRTSDRMITEHGFQEGISQQVLGIVVAHGDLFEHHLTLDVHIRRSTPAA